MVHSTYGKTIGINASTKVTCILIKNLGFRNHFVVSFKIGMFKTYITT